jgi:hypothetical protein
LEVLELHLISHEALESHLMPGRADTHASVQIVNKKTQTMQQQTHCYLQQ